MPGYRLPSDTNKVTLPRLLELMDTIPVVLKNIPEQEFSSRPTPDKWSKKEIIGHLIDSATNNHHRFIRGQFEDRPLILYDQVRWNQHGYYQKLDSHGLIDFWEMYNRHIHALISIMPADELAKECGMSDGKSYTLSWVFDDYVRHLEHHLKQILPPTP